MGKFEILHPRAIGPLQKFCKELKIERVTLPLFSHPDELYGGAFPARFGIERRREERNIHRVDAVLCRHTPETFAKRKKTGREGLFMIVISDAVVVHPIGDGDGKLGEHAARYPNDARRFAEEVALFVEELRPNGIAPDRLFLFFHRHEKDVRAIPFELERGKPEGKERIGKEMQPLADDVIVSFGMIGKFCGHEPDAPHFERKTAPHFKAAIFERQSAVHGGELERDAPVFKAGKLARLRECPVFGENFHEAVCEIKRRFRHGFTIPPFL